MEYIRLARGEYTAFTTPFPSTHPSHGLFWVKTKGASSDVALYANYHNGDLITMCNGSDNKPKVNNPHIEWNCSKNQSYDITVLNKGDNEERFYIEKNFQWE